MRRQIIFWHLTLATLLVASLSSSRALAQEDLEQPASWSVPTSADVKKQIDSWLEDRELDEVGKLKLEALWPETDAQPAGDELLDQVGATIALFYEPAQGLVQLCQQSSPGSSLPEFEFLADEKTPPFVRHNLRLLFGRWLAQSDLYDESVEQLKDLTPDQVVAPETLLFFQSAGYHRLLDKDKCLGSIAKLLERENEIAVRYKTVAQLMEADLKPLKTDSLDEVARLMDDIRRRLDLGRAGTRVRKQEDDVIAKLDKLIEELEKQQQGGGGGGGGALNPSSPAPDSANLEGKGPGNVDQRSIGNGDGWGDLPPKERQEALQQISKELPAHYREVIEEYFRKLARDGGN